MDIIRRRYNISIYLSIYLSQLGVKRLNKYIFLLYHNSDCHFKASWLFVACCMFMACILLSIESLDVKIIRICSQNFGFKVINLLCCCCFFLTWINAGTFCGVFRRQALDRGAMALKVDKIVTGKKCLSCICKFITANYSAEAWWENFFSKTIFIGSETLISIT